MILGLLFSKTQVKSLGFWYFSVVLYLKDCFGFFFFRYQQEDVTIEHLHRLDIIYGK
jgi:hypothetical protein